MLLSFSYIFPQSEQLIKSYFNDTRPYSTSLLYGDWGPDGIFF